MLSRENSFDSKGILSSTWGTGSLYKTALWSLQTRHGGPVWHSCFPKETLCLVKPLKKSFPDSQTCYLSSTEMEDHPKGNLSPPFFPFAATASLLPPLPISVVIMDSHRKENSKGTTLKFMPPPKLWSTLYKPWQ